MRFQGIVEQPTPVTLDQVCTGMSSVGWSRSFIPNFAVLEQPVRAFVMRMLGSGTKSIRRAKRFKLAECGWTDGLQREYDRLRLAVVKGIKRAYRDYDKVACLIWDASKYAWSYSITQVALEEVTKPWPNPEGPRRHWCALGPLM